MIFLVYLRIVMYFMAATFLVFIAIRQRRVASKFRNGAMAFVMIVLGATATLDMIFGRPDWFLVMRVYGVLAALILLNLVLIASYYREGRGKIHSANNWSKFGIRYGKGATHGNQS